MYFITGANLSSGLNIEVSIPSKHDVIKVPIRVIRIEKDNIYDSFGAELLNPCQDYRDFVHSIKAQSYIPS